MILQARLSDLLCVAFLNLAIDHRQRLYNLLKDALLSRDSEFLGICRLAFDKYFAQLLRDITLPRRLRGYLAGPHKLTPALFFMLQLLGVHQELVELQITISSALPHKS